MFGQNNQLYNTRLVVQTALYKLLAPYPHRSDKDYKLQAKHSKPSTEEYS